MLNNPEFILSWRASIDKSKQVNQGSLVWLQLALNRLYELYCVDDLQVSNSFQSRQAVFEYLQRAAQTGDAFAMFLEGLAQKTGFGCAKDLATGNALILIAAKARQCPDALNYLGMQYFKADPSLATKIFNSAAELGNVHAHKNLGICYLFGHGVKQDYMQALLHLRPAGEVAKVILAKVAAHLRKELQSCRASKATARATYKLDILSAC